MKAIVSLATVVVVVGSRAIHGGDGRSVGRIHHSMVWTGEEALVWGGGSDGVFHRSGLRIDPMAKGRAEIAERGAPSGRWGHAAAWSGSEMIVWGGRSQFFSESHFKDGGRYNPATDEWREINLDGAPTARSQMAAVWTGREMLVWGGYGDGANAWNTGGRYDPKADKWRPISEVDAPDARVSPLFVWTGKEMLVWGGITPDLKRTERSGGRYDPASDRWRPIKTTDIAPPVWGARGVWTGKEMIVWGGSHINGDVNINQVLRSGAAYDPEKDSWRRLNDEGAPEARFFHEAVWTGKQMVVWGGGDQGDANRPPKTFNDGGVYDPVADRWTPLEWNNRASGRGMHTAVWTGRGVMIFGGSTGGSTAFSDAAVWRPR